MGGRARAQRAAALAGGDEIGPERGTESEIGQCVDLCLYLTCVPLRAACTSMLVVVAVVLGYVTTADRCQPACKCCERARAIRCPAMCMCVWLHGCWSLHGALYWHYVLLDAGVYGALAAAVLRFVFATRPTTWGRADARL